MDPKPCPGYLDRLLLRMRAWRLTRVVFPRMLLARKDLRLGWKVAFLVGYLATSCAVVLAGVLILMRNLEAIYDGAEASTAWVSSRLKLLGTVDPQPVLGLILIGLTTVLVFGRTLGKKWRVGRRQTPTFGERQINVPPDRMAH
jgi:hypothetical protein